MRSYKSMHKEAVRRIALDVIESARDNSTGTTISKRGIFQLIRDVMDSDNGSFEPEYLDEKIIKNESTTGGYLVKAFDFVFGFRNNISLVMELYEEMKYRKN